MKTISALFLTLFTTAIAVATPPGIVNYQGLIHVDGSPFTGIGSFKFTLVNAAGTITYWSNDGTSAGGSEPAATVSITVTNGRYSVALGDTSIANMSAPVPASVFAANADVRLRVWFNDGTNGFQLLSPDQRLASVGYALNAATAQAVAAGSISAASLEAGLLDSAADDLGNHTATQTLNLAGNNLSNGGTVTATAFVGDGSGLTNLPTGPAGNSWSLMGNAGTTKGTDFLGTTDNVPLEFRVNNACGLRLEYTEFEVGPGVSFTAPTVIGGFSGNTADVGRAGVTIGGGGLPGLINSVTGDFGTISGGYDNTAQSWATVGGGYGNSASGIRSTISGGIRNTASNRSSMVARGEDNVAAGSFSFAAGRRAKANHGGAFVWADNTDADFSSTATQQFLIRAGGGIGINKNNPATALDVNGTVTATAFVGDGSGLTGVTGDNLGNHIATQAINLSGNNIVNGGQITAFGFVGSGAGLTGINVNDADSDPTNEIQDLASVLAQGSSGGGANLSNLGTVTAAAFVGNGSGLTGTGDNLGNHIATQNVRLNGNYLSGDGGNEGLFVDATGKVGIGNGTPAEALEVAGNVQLTRDDPRIRFLDNTGSNGDRSAEIRATLVSDLATETPQSQKMELFVNGSQALTLQGDGNVGIGTSNPGNKLSVSGDGGITGNLGIGTTTPAAKLDVAATGDGASLLRLSTDRAWAFQQEGVANNASLRLRNIAGLNKSLHIDTDGSTVFRSQNGSSSALTVQHTSRRIGIGTATPQASLHVAGNAATANGDGNYFWYAFPDLTPTRDISQVINVAAYFEGSIVAAEAVASMNVSSWSDARAKEIIARSNGKNDLELLKQIRITDYRWKDSREDHGRIHKKVIAQELEPVLPNAVSRARKAIPNVYANATKVSHDSLTRRLTIFLRVEHGFKTGDKARVFTNAEDLQEVEVLDVPSAHSFTIAAAKATGAFVYGKWVDDYRNVDYDAIAMLNVSATQEQQRLIESQAARIAELAARNTELARQNKAFEQRFSVIETALSRLGAEKTKTLATVNLEQQ